MGAPRGTLEERFWRKVDRDGPIPERRPDLGPCWIWTGSPDAKGYGVIREGGAGSRTLRAHRVGYELIVGSIPEGLEPDHLCRNRMCVNHAHLDPVTHRENILRGETFAARQVAVTHCPQGHAYDDANTRWKLNRTKRDCRACDRDRHQRKRAARRLLTPAEVG